MKCTIAKIADQNVQDAVVIVIVIVITFYSPTCLGQETAKGPFGLLVKLPPAHLSTTHGGGFTLSLLMLNVKTEVELRRQPSGPRPRTQKNQEPTFQGQILSRPRTGMVEAKAKDEGQSFSKLWLTNFP